MKAKKYILVEHKDKFKKIIDVEKEILKKRDYFINQKTNKVFWKEMFNDNNKKLSFAGEFISQSNDLNSLVENGDFVLIELDGKDKYRQVSVENGELIIDGVNLRIDELIVKDILRSYSNNKFFSLTK